MGSGGGISEFRLNNIIYLKRRAIFLHPLPVGKNNSSTGPGKCLHEGKYILRTRGYFLHHTCYAQVIISPPFSRHALRVQQHAPIMSEKLRNFRLPDGCFFQLALPGTVFPHGRFHMIVRFGWASQKNKSAGARGGQISGTAEKGEC